MEIKMVDVEVHIDETLDKARRESLVDKVREQDGVISVGSREETPHLMIIEYNPEQVNSQQLLHLVQSEGLHAELFGL